MAAAGLSADQIADVVARVEEERMAKARVGNAKRQQALRDRRNANNGVTAVTSNAHNGENSVTPVTKERPHTPKETPPLPSPPKGGSVSPPAGGSNDPKLILGTVLPAELVDEVVAHRKAMKAPLTIGAAKGLAKAFAASGNPAEAAQTMMTRGWRGYVQDWVDVGREARAGPNGKSNDGISNALRKIAAHVPAPRDEDHEQHPTESPNPRASSLGGPDYERGRSDWTGPQLNLVALGSDRR